MMMPSGVPRVLSVALPQVVDAVPESPSDARVDAHAMCMVARAASPSFERPPLPQPGNPGGTLFLPGFTPDV